MPVPLIDTGLRVESPEGVSFTYQLASLSERGVAYGIDLLIRVVVVIVVGLLLMLALGPAMLAGVGVWLVLYFVVEWGYYVFFDAIWDGQSPGKRLLELRVVKADGRPISFFDSVLRNLLRAADQLPMTYATGAISVIFTRRFQRLGDLAADTVVVHEQKAWYSAQPPQIADDALSGAIRGVSLSNREQRLLQEFVRRKDRLHPERCEQLAEILARPYSYRFGLSLAEGQATDLLVRMHATQVKRSEA